MRKVRQKTHRIGGSCSAACVKQRLYPVGFLTSCRCFVHALLSSLTLDPLQTRVGISVRTQELFLMVFVTRYLDLFTTYYSLYNSVHEDFVHWNYSNHYLHD